MIHHGVSCRARQSAIVELLLTPIFVQAAEKTKKGEGSHDKGPGAGAEEAENDPHREQVGGTSNVVLIISRVGQIARNARFRPGKESRHEAVRLRTVIIRLTNTTFFDY